MNYYPQPPSGEIWLPIHFWDWRWWTGKRWVCFRYDWSGVFTEGYATHRERAEYVLQELFDDRRT